MAGAHRPRRFRRHDFFFISGFIITRLMISEWDKTGTISIKKFYIRRFFRLMPALIVFVVLSLITMQLAHVELDMDRAEFGIFLFRELFRHLYRLQW
jgi:peptidoglycan/LPS O-acetylase OafA/YrhL